MPATKIRQIEKVMPLFLPHATVTELVQRTTRRTLVPRNGDEHVTFEKNHVVPDYCMSYFIPLVSCINTGADMVEGTLGSGTLGTVVRGRKLGATESCAIKIIRSRENREAALNEIETLTKIKDNDPNNMRRCLRIRDCFEADGHIFLITDLYGKNLSQLIRSTDASNIDLSFVRRVAKQVFSAVTFVHSLRLIHTDIKPENLVLRRDSTTVRPEIVLIDFGSSETEPTFSSNIITTPLYRAPEVILRQGWGQPCDVWSVGCVLYEVLTRRALFNPVDSTDHLAMIETISGVEFTQNDLLHLYVEHYADHVGKVWTSTR